MTTIKFPGLTRLDIPVERVLNGALDADLDNVVTIGFGKNGDFYFASSLADGGNVAWLLTRALHNLHQQADELVDAEGAAQPEKPGEVVPIRPITIHKPRAPEKLPGGGNKWADACSGRLVLGTGCGACLRCNREWYAVLRQVGDSGGDTVVMTPDQVQAALERVPEAGPGPMADYEWAMKRLTSYVDEWNRASAVGDVHHVRQLDIALRNMTFPPGVELVDDLSTTQPRKRIIHAAQTQA